MKEVIRAGRRPRFRLGSMGQSFKVTSIDEEGKLP